MSSAPRSVAIVGGGLAAGSVAAALRERGFDGRIVIAGDESFPPYERPPLSKAVLRGEDPELAYKPDDFYAENGIEMRLGVRATALDASAKRVTLDDGEALDYDALVIATGGRARRLDVPGGSLAGIYTLRTLGDAHALRDAAAAASHAVVVGMGFIGAEVAGTLRQRGLDVTAVEPFATPLERVLGTEVGVSVERLHRDHGVRMRLGEGVTAFDGSGRVEAVVTSTGERIECDMVVAGVGIIPNTEWLEGSGIVIGNGVLVDAACRTATPDVYAAGDVARHEHPMFGDIRVEHWQNALRQGAHVAGSILGSPEPYGEVHWFWSDQYDASLQYAGHHSGPADVVARGTLGVPPFTAFYLQDGIVKAAFGFNANRDVRAAMKIVGRAVDPGVLSDPDTDLRKL